MRPKRMAYDVTSPAGLAAISDLRERFVEDPETDLSGLRPQIARSWQRCAAMHVDPNARVVATDDSARIDAQTLQCAAPFLEELEHVAIDAGGAVTLTSPCGALVTGGAPYLQEYFTHGLLLLESVCGTNSDGTAIEEGRGGWVYSREHYVADPTFQDSSCYSTLLRDPFRNNVRAILGFTLPEDVAMKADTRSVSLLVEGVAAKITRALAARSATRDQALFGEYLKATRRHGNAAVIATSGKSTIVTDSALELLREDDFATISGYAQEVLRSRRSVKQHVVLSGERGVELHLSLAGDTATPIGAIVVVKPATSAGTARRKRARRPDTDLGGTPGDARTFPDLVGDSPDFRQALSLAATAVACRKPTHIIGGQGVGKHAVALRIAGAWSLDTETFDGTGPEPGSDGLADTIRRRLETGGAVIVRNADALPNAARRSLIELFEQLDDPAVVLTLRRPTAAAIELMSSLNGIEIALPSLRARREDIGSLATRFIADVADKRPSARLLYVLAQSDWPRNVAQLKAVVEQAAMVARGPEVGVADLPESFRGGPSPAQLSRLEELELHELRAALKEANGNRTQAARILQMGRSTIYRRLDSYRRRGIVL